MVKETSSIIAHYLILNHPSFGFGLFGVIAVPPTIKNLTSYDVIVFFSSYIILIEISIENVSLSFSSNDLTIF